MISMALVFVVRQLSNKAMHSDDPYKIAEEELIQKKLPYMIRRKLPSDRIGKFEYEYRTLDELTYIV